MERISTAPTNASFTPLSVHQSQTPSSFYSGPPVLYHHSPSATLSIRAHDLAAAPALSGLAEGAHRRANGAASVVNGGDGAGEEEVEEEEDEEIEIAGVDVWVTSERFILYSPSQSSGLSIPYPSISLHAIQRPSPSQPASLFLQILASAQTFDDHDPDSTISITITPGAALPDAETASEPQPERQETPTQALYTALSACANLHPDPLSGSEADDGEQTPAIMFEGDQEVAGVYPLSDGASGGGSALPPHMPGSGGWITAENVGEFFDEEGNWRGGINGGLGDGAGSVRGREEDADEGEVDGEVDGGGVGEETKWRRTE